MPCRRPLRHGELVRTRCEAIADGQTAQERGVGGVVRRYVERELHNDGVGNDVAPEQLYPRKGGQQLAPLNRALPVVARSGQRLHPNLRRDSVIRLYHACRDHTARNRRRDDAENEPLVAANRREWPLEYTALCDERRSTSPPVRRGRRHGRRSSDDVH